MTAKRISAPGSLLLAGEYRVTEEGGLGIALATPEAAYLTCEDALEFSLEERRPGAEENSHLLGAALAALEVPVPRTGRVTLDTTAMYAEDGRKWGLGSSAAAALLLCRFLLDTSDLAPSEEDSIATALRTHRRFQNGSGSGYDIYTSAHGGAGLFTGGEKPSWQPIPWPSGVKGYLLRGPAPVSSAAAVLLYARWTGRERSSLLAEMDERVLHVSSLLTSGAPCNEFLSEFAALGALGVLIGDAIGVPARPLLPEGLGIDIPAGRRPGAVVKCLGAGDELALLLYRDGALTSRESALLDNLVKKGRAKISVGL